MLKIEKLKKVFGAGTPDARMVLDDFSLDVKKGEFITIIGGNGAGKSTLFNSIAGSILPDGGRIELDGHDITFWPEHKRASLVGRIFQDPLMGTAPSLTVEENLSIAYMRSTKKSMLRALGRKDRAMLADRLAGLGLGLESRMRMPMGRLSGGQRQAVTLVMATLVVPKLLLLDEHTAALDPVSAEHVIRLTKEIVETHGITTLMITHNIASALQTGSRTILLDEGGIAVDVSGSTRQNMTVQGMLDLFAEIRKKAFDCDRALL